MRYSFFRSSYMFTALWLSLIFQYYAGTLHRLFPFTSSFGIFRISIKTLRLGLVKVRVAKHVYFDCAPIGIFKFVRKKKLRLFAENSTAVNLELSFSKSRFQFKLRFFLVVLIYSASVVSSKSFEKIANFQSICVNIISILSIFQNFSTKSVSNSPLIIRK